MFDDLNVTGESGFVLRGATGGLAVGQHQLTPDSDLAGACFGEGTRRIGNTISFATQTPLEG